MSSEQIEYLEVTVTPKVILFQSVDEETENTYTVLACTVGEEDKEKVNINNFGNITISGDNLTDLTIDVPRKVLLTPSVSSKYPDGYTARIPIDPIPDNAEDQWTFLSTIITENNVNAFRQVFDDDEKIISIIMEPKNHEKIKRHVIGYKEKRLAKLIQSIKEREEYARAYVLLSEYEMTDNMIHKIYNKYLDVSVIENILKNNIFKFTEVNNIGFKKIDDIYLKMESSKKEDEGRIKSGLAYYLEENQNDGNTRLSKHKLLQGTQALLDIPLPLIRDCLNKYTVKISIEDFGKILTILNENDKVEIVDFNGKYSTRSAFLAEYSVFVDITDRTGIKPNLLEYDMDDMINRFQEKEGFILSDEQRQFFLDLYKNQVSFLIGNAGSGKTTSQKVLLQYARETGQTITFLAPTGIARKKLEEYTGHKAYTIHTFVLSKDMPVTNIYFIDESSMVDVMLAQKLLSRIPMGAKIVFAGDDGQIPSVSFGNFLYDCINNDTVFVNRYTKIFRQKEGGILDIVTRIKHGQAFLPNVFRERKVFGKNCVFDLKVPRGQATLADKAVQAYKNTIGKKDKYKEEDVIIITPTKKGANGTVSINNAIQKFMNPPSQDKEQFESMTNKVDVIFRVGDLVMNRKNYKEVKTYHQIGETFVDTADFISIVNGDMGKIIAIDNGRKDVYVEFDGQIVKFNMQKFNSGLVIHGWCITGHKSQGSEYKVVICIIDKGSAFQMNGNLLYTMTSRAKELLLVLGDSQTINRSLQKFENLRRETNLLYFFKMYDKLKELNGDALHE